MLDSSSSIRSTQTRLRRRSTSFAKPCAKLTTFRTKVSPIVRIRNLGDNGVDYEVKYWLEDYAKFNDTDALVRQRIWYAFRRAGFKLRLPHAHASRRTSHERGGARQAMVEQSQRDSPRSTSSRPYRRMRPPCWLRLQSATSSHLARLVIRAGDPGSSMFVVHKGRVSGSGQ